MMTLEKIMDELIWVVKLNEGGRITGTYKEIEHLMDDCRDMDLAAKQPTDELQNFLDAMNKYTRENDWITVQDFYEIYSKA
jgi:hypothetical protein